MITVSGNGRRGEAAPDFAKIESVVARIRARNRQPAQSIARAMHESTLSQLIVTRIGVYQRRHHGIHHEILDRAIREFRSVAFGIPFCSLAVTGLTVLCLTDSRQYRVPGILYVVE